MKKRIGTFNDDGTISVTERWVTPPGSARDYETLGVFVDSDGVLRAFAAAPPPASDPETVERAVQAAFEAVHETKHRNSFDVNLQMGVRAAIDALLNTTDDKEAQGG